MWISFDPRNKHVDVYPYYVQILLDNDLHIKRKIPLGPSCFNAVISMDDDNNVWQKTPAKHGKCQGMRSVIKINKDERYVNIYTDKNGFKTLHPISITFELYPIGYIPDTVVFEWSLKDNLAQTTEKDWIPYDESTCEKLEHIWQQKTGGSIDLQLGLRNYKINISNTDCYHEQVDVQRHRKRVVRRVLLPQNTIINKRSLLQQRVKDFKSDDECALCYENFIDTPHMLTRTLECGHIFHGACVQPVILNEFPRCPLCRQQITS